MHAQKVLLWFLTYNSWPHTGLVHLFELCTWVIRTEIFSQTLLFEYTEEENIHPFRKISVLPATKRTWPLQAVHAVTGSVFKAAQILRHHGVSLLFLLLVIVREEGGSQFWAQRAGHEVHGRDGVVGHIWAALHVPNLMWGKYAALMTKTYVKKQCGASKWACNNKYQNAELVHIQGRSVNACSDSTDYFLCVAVCCANTIVL